MRLFWAGVLTTGLLLIGLSTYERQDSADLATSALEDGSGFPQPYPTPTPKP
jgi:hypothetical protein